MPYGIVYLGQHWFRWWHQAIIWTNVDWSSVRSCGIHLRAISQEILMISILDMSLNNNWFKITDASPRNHWVYVGGMLSNAAHQGSNSDELHYYFPFGPILWTGVTLWLYLYWMTSWPHDAYGHQWIWLPWVHILLICCLATGINFSNQHIQWKFLKIHVYYSREIIQCPCNLGFILQTGYQY